MKKGIIFAVGIFLIVLGTAITGIAKDNPGGLQIDAIQDSSIVLGDMVFTISGNANFFAKDKRTPISFSQFKEGDWVGVIVNSNNEIIEMWLSSE